MRRSLTRPIHLYGRHVRLAPRLPSADGLRHAHPSQTLPRRFASTEAQSAGGSKILNFFYGTTLLVGFGIIYVYITDTRASVHKYVVVPTLRWIYRDPEKAHEAGNYGLKSLWQLGLYPRERGDPDQKGDLTIEVFGHVLRNPIGTSAGIDKHAEIPDPLMAIGPAIVEIGGVTPVAQPGNEKPRVFRIASQNAMINRYGLNSEGADHIAARLKHRVREYAYEHGFGHDAHAERLVLDGVANVPPGSLVPGKLLAINIAKNKETPGDDIQAISNDYVYCVQRLAPYADILVVNVSSPNTPGLRSLQQGESLKKILTSVVDAAKSTDRKTKPAVMVKVSPDEDSDEQVLGIAQAVWESGVDGVIVGNTTNRRPEPLPHLRKLTSLEQEHLLEQGGFSGPHLFERTVALVKKYKGLLDNRPDFSPPSAPSRSRGSLTDVADNLRTELKASTGAEPTHDPDKVAESVDTGYVPAHNISDKPESEKKPLINLPTNKFYDQTTKEQNKLRESPTSSKSIGTNDRKSDDHVPPSSSSSSTMYSEEPKVIFATGGITNGKQALEVLNAGASVAMVYTALVYGGVGTISRIKDEMRDELQNQAAIRKQKST